MSVISDEIAQDVGLAAQVARDGGADGLEIRSAFGRPARLLSEADLRCIGLIAEDHNLAISGFCSPALKCELPSTGADLRRCREEFRHAVQQAVVVRSPSVRIFSFLRHDARPDPAAAATAAARVVRGIDVPSGLRLLIETGTWTHTPTLETATAFLRVFGRPDTGVLWDPANAVSGDFPAQAFPAERGGMIRDVRHVHVKDPLLPRSGVPHYVPLGTGLLPWPEIVSALAGARFDGWVTLETHWRPGRRFTRQELDAPGGELFSVGGQEASATDLRTLRDLLDGAAAPERRP